MTVPVDQRDRENLVGHTIAQRYSLRRVLGRGGVASVYEADDHVLRRAVAIKVLDRSIATDERIGARFARETRAAGRIKSDHVVPVIDAGTEGGRLYLVMELLQGEDLGARLRRERQLGFVEVVRIAIEICRGLAAAHKKGIIHRDLKPDNVFLQRGEDGQCVKLLDFGTSKLRADLSSTAPIGLTVKGFSVGTPLYMAPEQARGLSNVDERADLYSAGAIVFECIAGRPPHVGDTDEQIMLASCTRDAPDLRAVVPTVPSAIAAWVSRALQRDPAARFASADEMLRALREIAPEASTWSKKSVHEELSGLPASFLRGISRELLIACVVAVVLGILTVVAAIALLRGRKAKAEWDGESVGTLAVCAEHREISGIRAKQWGS